LTTEETMTSEYAKLIDFRSGDEFPEWAKDGVSVRTTVHLDWRDRLKILLFGRLEVDTFTATEELPGRCETRSCIHVFFPRWPRKPVAYEAVQEPQK
jgi:hypothetical protein